MVWNALSHLILYSDFQANCFYYDLKALSKCLKHEKKMMIFLPSIPNACSLPLSLSVFYLAMNLRQYLKSGKTMHKFPNKSRAPFIFIIMEMKAKEKNIYITKVCCIQRPQAIEIYENQNGIHQNINNEWWVYALML